MVKINKKMDWPMYCLMTSGPTPKPFNMTLNASLGMFLVILGDFGFFLLQLQRFFDPENDDKYDANMSPSVPELCKNM